MRGEGRRAPRRGDIATLLVFAGLAIAGCGPADSASTYEDYSDADFEAGAAPIALGLEVLATHPHDAEAFTQGLIEYEGDLYESTGLNGRSSLRRVDPETGVVEQRVDLSADHFAEGLERVDDRLIQLTWQSGKAFVYDLDDFERRGEFDYPTEGWGLCYQADAGRLVMSDGTSTLYFRDPESFAELGRVAVSRSGQPQDMLNELECVGKVVYANIWQSDEIVVIDPDSGAIGAVIDTRAAGSDPLLGEEERAGADVLNGIVWRPETGTFLITGKLWPKLFEVRLREGTGAADG